MAKIRNEDSIKCWGSGECNACGVYTDTIIQEPDNTYTTMPLLSLYPKEILKHVYIGHVQDCLLGALFTVA